VVADSASSRRAQNTMMDEMAGYATDHGALYAAGSLGGLPSRYDRTSKSKTRGQQNGLHGETSLAPFEGRNAALRPAMASHDGDDGCQPIVSASQVFSPGV
jgi:hypothetical protein